MIKIDKILIPVNGKHDDVNKKILEPIIKKQIAIIKKQMFTDKETVRTLSYAEMVSMYC